MKKETAVEWLERNLPSLFQNDSGHYRSLFDKAKAIEKKQIVAAGDFCQKQENSGVIIAAAINGPILEQITIGEDYYRNRHGYEEADYNN